MTRHLLMVSSRALPGRESDYDRWYEEVHAGEVLALPGFVACERFRRLAEDGGAGEFVALYEVETDDPPALLASLFAAVPTMCSPGSRLKRSVAYSSSSCS